HAPAAERRRPRVTVAAGSTSHYTTRGGSYSMVPDTFIAYFAASAGASAALIGLLFVAVSLAPERVFGRQALVAKQTEALSAFTALANVFFISLGALVPGLNIGMLAMIVALMSLAQTLSLLALWPRWRRERRA